MPSRTSLWLMFDVHHQTQKSQEVTPNPASRFATHRRSRPDCAGRNAPGWRLRYEEAALATLARLCLRRNGAAGSVQRLPLAFRRGRKFRQLPSRQSLAGCAPAPGTGAVEIKPSSSDGLATAGQRRKRQSCSPVKAQATLAENALQ